MTKEQIIEKQTTMRNFIIGLNYAYKYGSHDPKNKEQTKRAEIEFGEFANEKIELLFIKK